MSNKTLFFLLFTKQQILDSTKLKGFADDNFKFDKNDGKFSKWSFENTVGKREIACNKPFHLSHSAFCPFRRLSANFIEFKIVVCKLFQFGRV